MKNKQAFTLIELLVVVLIIGILAAAALPQYQVAVAKSRLAAGMPTVKAMKQAAESYYIANGSYENDVFTYDVELDGCNESTPYWCDRGQEIYDILTASGFCDWDAGVFILTPQRSIVNTFGICLDHSNNPGKSFCGAPPDNSTANKVCKSMGGTFEKTGLCFSGSLGTPACNLYTLP